MKKIYLIIGALLLMFVLLGCDEAGNLVVPTDVTLPTGELTTNEDMTTVDGTTTEIPTTIEGATTEAPTTEVPATTEAPTTTEGATTTEAPTTEAPTTEAPTTEVPTTEVPTTEAPTTEAPTTDPSEPVVLLDNPTNLSIDGQVLSWTEVPNAVGYKVYVDGNFQAEVSTNQYDFSSIVEDYMVFNVRAIAFAEESNSNLSLDIVYNVNSASEILAMDTFMQTSGMDVSDSQAFATELVSRGMSVTEMQTMMTNMTPVMEKMQNKSSMSDIYPDLHTFLNGMTNIEALVSAFVRVELPNSIQSEIDDLTSIDGTCENYGEYYDQTGEIVTECYGYYDVSEDIEYLNRLLTFVETYPDEVVESVMVVINYMMRIENAITTQWVSDVDTLMQPASPGTFNINLAISVKNGLIMNFKNEMPSLNEFTLFNQTMMTFGTVMLDDNRMDSFIKAEKTAMQMQMSLGLVFNALLQIDAVYVNTLITALELEDEIAIITLQFDYINQFLEDNADELVALDNVYSAEEKEAIFFDLVISSILEMQGLTETEHDDIMLIIKDNIDFTNLLAMKTSTGDLLNDLLDRLDETDYELIIALHELATLPYNGSIIEDDDSGDEYNFKIDVTLDPGQYAVTVKGFSGYDVGEYDLLIYADYGSGPVLLETFTDTLSANDENQYTFTLIESAIVSIYTESLLDTFGILSEYSEVTLTEEEAVFNVLNSYIETMNPLVQDMTEVEYSVFINNVTSVIKTVIDIEDYYSTTNFDEMDSLLQVLDIISDTTPYQFALLQTFMNQMVLTDYITELQLAVETEGMAQMIIIQLDFINNYMDASALELATLDEIYTLEEKEAIFFDLMIASFLEMQGLTEIEHDDIMAIIETNIDLNKLLALQALSGDTLNDLLDRLDETEYALVYAFLDLMDVENTYYDDWNQYDLDRTEAIINLIDSYIDTMNPLVQDMTEVEYSVFINNVTSVIQTVIDIEDYYGTINIDEMDSMQLVLDIVSNTTPYQFVLLQTFMNQMVLTDYITELQLAVETEDMAQMIIIQLDFINNLMDASAVELAALDEIYTAEEKEAIFFDYIIAFFLDMNGLPEIERDDIIAIIETNIDFDKLLALQSLSGDTLNDLLDRLIITEYELVYAFVDLMDVENTYYDNWNQYDLDRTEAIAYLLDSFIYTINPLVQDMTEVEYGILVDNALQIIRTSIYINDYNWSSYTVDELIAINLVLDTISDTTPEQLAILQAMMNQIEVSNMIMDIYNIYYNNPGTFTPEVQDYGMLIILANVYVDTYDIAQTDIDALIADALLLLDNPAIQLEMGITPIEVAEIKAMISAYPDNLYTQALIVVNYDYTNLTTEQIEELIELIYWLETPYQVQLPPV